MTIEVRRWTDERHNPPVTLTVIETTGPWMPPVYISPDDTKSLSEIGSGDDFTRCSRDDLREYAQAILTALGES